MPTSYSASADDVKRISGDLAMVEETANGIAVYWHQVILVIKRIKTTNLNFVIGVISWSVWGMRPPFTVLVAFSLFTCKLLEQRKDEIYIIDRLRSLKSWFWSFQMEGSARLTCGGIPVL